MQSTHSRQRVYMPFGQHRGKRLDDVPTSYLAWASTIDLDRYPGLREAIADELDARRGRHSGGTGDGGALVPQPA
jgi:hypothetical protein